MNPDYVFALAAVIGIVTGLRSLTPPALVAWAAHLGWLHLQGSPLAFMGSKWAVLILSLGAVAELVNDKLPWTPSRTALPALIFRIVMGGLSGACLCASSGLSLLTGAALAGIGAVVGAFGGYQVRVRLGKALGVKDILVALPEDVVAIALAYFVCTRFI